MSLLALSFSPISGLDSARSPATIFRAVWTVVIKAFDGVVSGWSWPHVSKEVRKRLHPTIADSNTAPSVIRPTLGVFIGTAGFHGAPDVPFRTNACKTRHAVSGRSGYDLFCAETPAARAVAVSQRRAIDGAFIPAGAFANPLTQCVSANDGPAPKLATGHFDELRHNTKFTT